VPESTRILVDSIQPGDFIKVQLLGPPTIQFSGRFNSVIVRNTPQEEETLFMLALLVQWTTFASYLIFT